MFGKAEVNTAVLELRITFFCEVIPQCPLNKQFQVIAIVLCYGLYIGIQAFGYALYVAGTFLHVSG